MNWSLTMENSRDSHNNKIHRGGIRRFFNGQIFNKGAAFWEGTDITEEGDNYICIAPHTRNPRNQGFFQGLGGNGRSTLGGGSVTRAGSTR